MHLGVPAGHLVVDVSTASDGLATNFSQFVYFASADVVVILFFK